MKTIATWAGCVLALDALGFMLWAMSGQLPVDQFYIGTITAHIVRAFL